MPALKPEYQHQQLRHPAESSCLSHEELNGPKKQLKKKKRGFSALFTLRPWKNRCDDGGGATVVAVLDSTASATTTTPSAGEARGGRRRAKSRSDSRQGNIRRSVRFNAASRLPTAITLSSSKPNKDKNKDSHLLDLHHEELEGSTSSGTNHDTRLLRGAFIEGIAGGDDYIEQVESGSVESDGETQSRVGEESTNQWFGEVHFIPLGDLDDAVLDIDLWSQDNVVTDSDPDPSSSSTQRRGTVDLRPSCSDCSAATSSSNFIIAMTQGKLRNFLARSPVKLRRSMLEDEVKQEEGLKKYARQATTAW